MLNTQRLLLLAWDNLGVGIIVLITTRDKHYYDEYHNSDYEVFDAVPNNVLYGIDGDLYFIDTQIRLRS